MTQEAAAEGPYTREDAVRDLIAANAEPAPEPAQEETAAETVEEPEQNTEGDDQAPEEPAEGAEIPAGEEPEAEAETEAVAPLDPPKYWSQEAKADFSKLTPELQAVVLAQEGPREEAAAKAKAEAAEVVKASKAEMGKVQALAEHLGEFLPQALETFQSRWGQKAPDWAAVATEHGADQAFILKAQFEAETQQLQQLASAKQQAATLAQQEFVKAEFARLAEIAPDLADPEKGAEKRTAVTTYLVGQGIEPEALRNISATEMVLAHKAMLWDQAQTALKAAPKPTPKPAPKPAPVRPAAAQPGTSQQRATQTLERRFAQTKNREDAVALILAKGL
jgi:hypothetical protein